MDGQHDIGIEEENWVLWDYRGSGQWPEQWPPVRLRRVDGTHIYFEMMPLPHMGNRFGTLHGGFLACFAEHCLGIFVEPFSLPISTITVSVNIDYPASGTVGRMIEGRAELVRETGRMQFMRLELLQNNEIMLIANGVLRKVPRQ